MAMFTCGHELPKGRIGANLSHVPRDSSNRCPGCQTKTPSGVIGLLKSLQKPSAKPQKPRETSISQHLITFAFDRFISQRKTPGFKSRVDEVFDAFGEVCYRLLDRKQIASFSITARGRWGIDVTRQAWRAVGTAVLKTNGVYEPIEPAEAEILHTLNNMIELMRERAASVDTFEQLEIVYNSASTLRMLRDQVTSALSELEDGFTKWDAVGK
ncbi:hypothetical protein F4818DRAFT_202808 [Hypoxylon cercidicola]|nr:hypothetical protein F4818DRAFT_202808 [Hypoxylon cercidicola]